ncbi:YncE family protein [Mycobacterium sp. JS623]|uniref:YncE family protein n=1 Tax=Mycobacterium sp. JS623 TaxID=212767 RepID=UPI0009FBF496|nr:beta-propeller fold lactonase family protein [Mycobacterium sp. JS623]
MSAPPALNSAPEQLPASAGWTGVISAILVALGRRPSVSDGSGSLPSLTLTGRMRSIFQRQERASSTAVAPVRARDGDGQTAAVQTVPGVGPVRDIALSSDGRYAYVASHQDTSGADACSVDVVETTTNTVVKKIVLSDVGPTSLAASPDSSRLYVADHNAAAIRVVDIAEGSPTRNRVVDSLPLEGPLPVGYGTPSSIVLSPNGSRLYAQMTDPAVLIVDPDTRVLVGTVAGGDSIAMFAAGERIYVCADDRLGHSNVAAGVVILDADTGSELGSFGLNDAPAFISQPILAGDSGQLYLDIDDLDGRLEVVDTSTLNVVARIKIDASADRQLRSIPAAAVLSPDGGCLYVANQGVRSSSEEATEVGWISVVDTNLNEVIDDIALPEADECQGANPQFIVISPAGDRLVVVNEYGIVSIIDVASRAIVGTVTLGRPTDQPRVVTVNPARNAVYVGGDAGLTVIPL